MDIRWQLVCFIAGLGLFHHVAEGCDTWEMENCQNTFLNALGISPSNIRSGNIPHISGNKLGDVCRTFKIFSDCIKPYKSGCSDETQIIYATEVDTYDYICNDGFEDQVKYGDCLLTDRMKADSQDCAADMKSASYYGMSESKFCDIMDEGIACQVRAARKHCGPASAAYSKKLLEHAFKAMAKKMGCESDVVTIAIAVGAAIGGILLLSLVCYVIHRRKMRETQRSTNDIENSRGPRAEVQANHYAEPPPAYTINNMHGPASVDPAAALPVSENLRKTLLITD